VIPDAFLSLFTTAAEALAPAWNAVRGLRAAEPWLWLVRSGALEPAAAIGVVLLDRLPGLLVAVSEEVLRHG